VNIKIFVSGLLFTNSYLVSDKKEAVLIDCGGEPKEILEEIKVKKLKLKYILLTHGHGDHIYGLNQIRKETGAKIGLHEKDVAGLNHSFNLSIVNAEPVKEDFHIKEGDQFRIGEIIFEVIETPGHTPGGVCFWIKNKKILFTGDTLFKTGVGRDDFPGGNWNELKQSLRRLIKMEEDIKIYPGHGQDSTIGNEKKFLLRSKVI